MKTVLTLFMITYSTFAFSQSEPLASINGNYTALNAERGTSGPSKDKVIQYGENNGTKMLAIAACDRCMPAVFTYNKESSEILGKPAFNNNVGYYVFTYDDDSFILISTTGDEVIKFSNFYSKDPSKAAAMTTAKVNDYAITMLEQL